MRHITEKFFVFQWLVALPLLAALAGCGSSGSSQNSTAAQLHAHGDDAAAASAYQVAIAAHPDDTDARMGLAGIVESHGNDTDAATQYRKVIAAHPDSGEAHRDLGKLYLKSNQPEAAKTEYEKALAIDSDDTKAQNGVGVALDMSGNHAAAQATYKSVLENEPDDLGALNNLAHSYVLVGSYDEAIMLLEPHLKDKGSTPALRQNLAEAYGMAGMEADAERVGRIDLTPDQVKHNLAYYRARRVQLDVMPKFYANLGDFPTGAMGLMRISDIRAKFPVDSAGLVLAMRPEVGSIGGTPKFSVSAKGFATPAKLRAFCNELKKAGFSCQPHGL